MVKCPKCKKSYKKAKTMFESHGVILKNVECFKCPKCGDEVFTPIQTAGIRKKIEAFVTPLSLERKISTAAGKKPVIYIPEEILKKAGLKIGDIVSIGIEDTKKVVILPV